MRLSPGERQAWLALLRGEEAIAHALDAELEAEHGLSLHAFELLRTLADEPQRRLRMSTLAARLGLSASGATRLVERLERRGLVARVACPEDARVTYAQLTATGERMLNAAEPTHADAVRRLFLDRLGAGERAVLGSLLSRLDPERGDAG